MADIGDHERLTQIDPQERILLLPQCLRPSQKCPGQFTKEGLVCPADCQVPCLIRGFREAAARLGYKGSCVAAGGSMALRFVEETRPQGIVAVACSKELEMGVEGVNKLTKGNRQVLVIVAIPLSKDGCLDTEVDEEEVLAALELKTSRL